MLVVIPDPQPKFFPFVKTGSAEVSLFLPPGLSIEVIIMLLYIPQKSPNKFHKILDHLNS